MDVSDSDIAGTAEKIADSLEQSGGGCLQPTLELTRQCHRQGRLLAAICHAPWILISAGVVRGKRATGFPAVKDDWINAGAEFVDLPVVRDGNLITSRTPLDLPEFCLEIISALGANQPQ